MRPRTEFSTQQIAGIRRAMQSALNRSSFQRLQCLGLRATQDVSTEQIADMVGLSVSHVRRVWSDYLRGGLAAGQGRPRGGRHREHLTASQERALLAPFQKLARDGRALTARSIQQAYEQRVGQSVPDSTVCRMLARQGWRKIQPRPKHPRRSKSAQTRFKKKISATGARRSGFLPPAALAPDV